MTSQRLRRQSNQLCSEKREGLKMISLVSSLLSPCHHPGTVKERGGREKREGGKEGKEGMKRNMTNKMILYDKLNKRGKK